MEKIIKALAQGECDPIERSFKWILVLGRAIGVVPVSISWKKPQLSLSFCWRSLPAMYSFLLSFILFLVLAPQILGLAKDLREGKHILDQLTVIGFPSFLMTSVFVFAHFLKNGKYIVNLMEKWKDVIRSLNLSTKDRGFPRFCASIVILILSIGIVENIFSNMSTIEKEAKFTEGFSELEKFYRAEGKRLTEWVPYNPIFGAIVVYSMKMAMFAWNFADVFLITLCRAVTFKFHEINEEILQHFKLSIQGTPVPLAEVVIEPSQNIIVQPKKVSPPKGTEVAKVISPGKFVLEGVLRSGDGMNLHPFQIPCSPVIPEIADLEFWKEIWNKVLILCELADSITKFVAPLVLACFGCNITLIITRVLQFLYDSTTIVENSVYIFSSSFQFFMRVLLVTYYASQVYHSTEKIVRTIELSSDPHISDTACRLERMLERHPVGVTILGTVTITRKFFISIISFMFTTEIILLQAMSAGNARS